MRVSEGASRSRWADEEGRRRGPGGCGRSDGWRRESLSESEDVVRGHAQWSRWGSFTFQAGMRRSRCVCERERERGRWVGGCFEVKLRSDAPTMSSPPQPAAPTGRLAEPVRT
jgi:hypothetical protein